MPELPEVETVRRGLIPVLEGRRIVRVEVRRPGLRIPFPDDLGPWLTGLRVRSIKRRGKYMLMAFDGTDEVLVIHLGMSGRMVINGAGGANRAHEPGPHDHVVIDTDGGTRIFFNDARRFGLMTRIRGAALDRHPLFAGLGPEPLTAQFTGASLAQRLDGRATPIKAALLDQRMVAGLGNIYVCEALYGAGISPRRKAANIGPVRAHRLVAAIKKVLTEAIAAGGSSLRDHVRPDGELGYFQHNFSVYGRQGAACPGCDCDIAESGGIRRIVQGGRSTFYCPRRQR
ncbi:MAG: bifunctional DNA-formamidopyrimidine glycosylase/DNA-(apurinic or apyrimidinic site) lyase [Alphaproteobacteria bacterium]|nr:MAG: bifunctional DNA-formamidopyrimidine glycosylase/DNA-(apurinic or apyrimidinic site) lyase [Alphaproteobacteria bacterium]